MMKLINKHHIYMESNNKLDEVKSVNQKWIRGVLVFCCYKRQFLCMYLATAHTEIAHQISGPALRSVVVTCDVSAIVKFVPLERGGQSTR